MKQRRRTRNQCRGKVRCYTNQIAASAFLQRDGKTVTLVDSDSPQLSTGTWYSLDAKLSALWGGGYLRCALPHLALCSQLQVQGRFAQACCIMSRGTHSLLFREPPPLSATVLKIKLGAERKPGFCTLRIQGSSGFIKSSGIDLHRWGTCMFVLKNCPRFYGNAWVLGIIPIWEIHALSINNH